jgi:hypothetical protein
MRNELSSKHRANSTNRLNCTIIFIFKNNDCFRLIQNCIMIQICLSPMASQRRLLQ